MIGFSLPWLMRLNRFLAGICGAKPQSRTMLLRVNQETGPPIVLFRRDFARFDSATLQRCNAFYVTD
jgi:hypothetical protein